VIIEAVKLFVEAVRVIVGRENDFRYTLHESVSRGHETARRGHETERPKECF
jgi:hypothetical protein